MKPINIVIIGAGNLAFHLVNFITKNKKLNLVQIFNHRASKDAIQLAKKSNCNFTTNYSLLNKEADFYFICVKDDAIQEVASNLKNIKCSGVFIHTSGSVNLDIISTKLKNTGVFYPLQTFSVNDNINWKQIPILIESHSKSSLEKLKALSVIFSPIVKNINSQKRLNIHLAAVFASNFTNSLYQVSQQIICNTVSKSEVKLLNPLLLQSFNKMLTLGPKKAQTGPAKRNDKVTMQKHLDLLKSNTQLSSIYKSLSSLIIAQQNEKL